jgi:hypothetical protein
MTTGMKRQSPRHSTTRGKECRAALAMQPMNAMRFRVDPRDVPAALAARRLGLTRHEFEEELMQLIQRGFPNPDPTTGHFDLKAIEKWMDRRSGLDGTSQPTALDAAAVVGDRIADMMRGS